jgi:hypothetical protein
LRSLEQLTEVIFTLSAYPNLARTGYPIFIQAPYPSLTQLHQCLRGLIRPYLAESPYPILLLIRLLLIWPYTVLPCRVTLPDLFLIRLLPIRSYPATVPKFIAWPGNTSLHPTAYPALPDHLAQLGTLQLASPKNSSSASHLDLCLFWPIMHQDSLGNPKPIRVTLKHPGNPICLTGDRICLTQPYPTLTRLVISVE